MVVIEQEQLRDEVGDVLRRAEAGEEFMVTVAGRAVAHIGPVPRNPWVPVAQLRDLFRLPADPAWAADLQRFHGGLAGPWTSDRRGL